MSGIMRDGTVGGQPAAASDRHLEGEGIAMDRPTYTAYDLEDFTVVVVAGDISGATDLRQILHTVSGARSRIAVDLTGVTFIDTTGLGVLLGALRRTRTADGWVRLICRDQAVLKVLRMTHLDSIFEIHDSVDDIRTRIERPRVPGPRTEFATPTATPTQLPTQPPPESDQSG
jgi:anti-sigma B factor antagonist